MSYINYIMHYMTTVPTAMAMFTSFLQYFLGLKMKTEGTAGYKDIAHSYAGTTRSRIPCMRSVRIPHACKVLYFSEEVEGSTTTSSGRGGATKVCKSRVVASPAANICCNKCRRTPSYELPAQMLVRSHRKP